MKLTRRIRRKWRRVIPVWMKCFVRSIAGTIRKTAIVADNSYTRARKLANCSRSIIRKSIGQCSEMFGKYADSWKTAVLAAGLLAAPAFADVAALNSVFDSGWAATVYAAPADGVVVAGEAAIIKNATVTDITQTSQRAVIDWKEFDVAANETVNFLQPNTDAAVLNRVSNGNISLINGTINANGQVYIVNPNGINIGSSASINVGGLSLGTAEINAGAFISGGKLQTAGGCGNIVIAGNIRAGSVSIENARNITVAGTIDASALSSGNGGTITIIADKEEGALDVSGARLFARAGKVSGNGGFIETSAAKLIGLDKVAINASAANGAGGVWLIDPSDLVVTHDIALNYQTALNGGTDVVNSVNGDMVINGTADDGGAAIISKTSNGNATLSFSATGNIIAHSGASFVSSFNKLNIAYSAGGAVVAAAAATNGGNFTISAAAGVGQCGAVTATGTVSIATSGSGATIDLTGYDNDFTAASYNFSGSGAHNAAIRNVHGPSAAFAINTLSGTLANLTIDHPYAPVTIGQSNMTAVTGNLSVSAGGAVTQVYAVRVDGTADITAVLLGTGGSVQLTNVANSFSSLALDAGDARIVNNKPLDLRDINLSNNLYLSINGGITQSDAAKTLNVVGLTAYAWDGGTNYYDISLDNNGNSIASVNAAQGRNLTLRFSNSDFGIGNVLASGGGLDGSGELTLHGNTLSGSTISATGAINLGMYGKLSVTGYAVDFKPGSYIHTAAGLTVSGYSLGYKNSGNLALGASNIGSGGMSVTAVNGNVSQTEAVTVSGTASFMTETAGAIILDNSGNDFQYLVNATSARTNDAVALTDCSGIMLGAITSGVLSVTALNGDIAAPGWWVNGINARDRATFVALRGTATSNDINLTQYGNTGQRVNSFSALVALSGYNATVSAVSGINFAASTLTGGLTVVAGGNVFDYEAVVAGGAVAVTATGHNITFDETGTSFHDAALSGAVLYVSVPGELNLSGLAASGAASIFAGGGITDSGRISAGSTITLISSGSDIVLDYADNTYSNLVNITANNVSFGTWAGGVTFGAVSAATLDVTAGTATVAGALTASDANFMNLYINNGGVLGNNGTTTTVSRNAFFHDGAVAFGSVSVYDTSVFSAGSIHLASTLLDGTMTFSSGSLAINSGANIYANSTGTTPSNNMAIFTDNWANGGGTVHVSNYTLTIAPKTSGVVMTLGSSSGNGLIISSTEISNRLQANKLVLGCSSAGAVTLSATISRPAAINDLEIDSGAELTQSSGSLVWADLKKVKFVLGGTASFTNAGNSLSYFGYTGKSLNFYNNGAVYFSGVNVCDASHVNENFDVTAAGEIGQSGGTTVVVGGTSNVQAVSYSPGAGLPTSGSTYHAVYLDNDGNSFGGAISLLANNASITGAGGLTLSNVTIGQAGGSTLGLTAVAKTGNIQFAGTNNFASGCNLSLSVAAGSNVGQGAAGKIIMTGGILTLKGGTTSKFLFYGNSANLAPGYSAAGDEDMPGEGLNGIWDDTRDSFNGTLIQTDGTVANINIISDSGFTLGNIATNANFLLDAGGSANLVSQSAGSGILMSGSRRYLTARNGSYTLANSGNSFAATTVVTTGYNAIEDTDSDTVLPDGNLSVYSSNGYYIDRIKAAGNVTFASGGGTVQQVSADNASMKISLIGNGSTLSLINSGSSPVYFSLNNAQNQFNNNATSANIVRMVNVLGEASVYAKDNYTLGSITYAASGAGTARAEAGGNLLLTEQITLYANADSRLYLGAGNTLNIGSSRIIANENQKGQLILWSGMTKSYITGTILHDGTGGTEVVPAEYFGSGLNGFYDNSLTAAITAHVSTGGLSSKAATGAFAGGEGQLTESWPPEAAQVAQYNTFRQQEIVRGFDNVQIQHSAQSAIVCDKPDASVVVSENMQNSKGILVKNDEKREQDEMGDAAV